MDDKINVELDDLESEGEDGPAEPNANSYDDSTGADTEGARAPAAEAPGDDEPLAGAPASCYPPASAPGSADTLGAPTDETASASACGRGRGRSCGRERGRVLPTAGSGRLVSHRQCSGPAWPVAVAGAARLRAGEPPRNARVVICVRRGACARVGRPRPCGRAASSRALLAAWARTGRFADSRRPLCASDPV